MEPWRATSYLGGLCGTFRCTALSGWGALRRLLDICTTVLDIMEQGTLWNMVDFFLKLCKGEKVSLTVVITF